MIWMLLPVFLLALFFALFRCAHAVYREEYARRLALEQRRDFAANCIRQEAQKKLEELTEAEKEALQVLLDAKRLHGAEVRARLQGTDLVKLKEKAASFLNWDGVNDFWSIHDDQRVVLEELLRPTTNPVLPVEITTKKRSVWVMVWRRFLCVWREIKGCRKRRSVIKPPRKPET